MKREGVNIGMMVRFHPIIGGKHDQNLYRVQAIGEAHGRDVVWLEGKGDLDVDIRAISAARPGVDGYGLLRDE